MSIDPTKAAAHLKQHAETLDERFKAEGHAWEHQPGARPDRKRWQFDADAAALGAVAIRFVEAHDAYHASLEGAFDSNLTLFKIMNDAHVEYLTLATKRK